MALLASLTKAPVVPAYISGADQAGRLAQIKVAFGKPLALPADRKQPAKTWRSSPRDVMSAIWAVRESIGGNS